MNQDRLATGVQKQNCKLTFLAEGSTSLLFVDSFNFSTLSAFGFFTFFLLLSGFDLCPAAGSTTSLSAIFYDVTPTWTSLLFPDSVLQRLLYTVGRVLGRHPLSSWLLGALRSVGALDCTARAGAIAADGFARARKPNGGVRQDGPSPTSRWKGCGGRTRVDGTTEAEAGEEDIQVQHCEPLGCLWNQTERG